MKRRKQTADDNERANDNAVHFERAVLGCCLEHPELVRETQLSPDEFLLTDHQNIWATMCTLSKDKQTLDIVTLTTALRGKVDPDYIGCLLEPGYVVANFHRYTDGIRDAGHERQFARLHERFDQTTKRDERIQLLDEMRERLEAIGRDPTKINQYQDIPDVLATRIEDAEPLVTDLFDRETLIMLSGESGVGKSSVALRLAVGIATGTSFLGRACVETPALILDRENPVRIVQKRIRTLAGGPIPNLRIWGHWLEDPPPLIGDPRLLEIAREHHPIIIFDSFIRFHAADENSSAEMKIIMSHLRALANAGATVLLLHHRPKSQLAQYRGSSDILAAVDSAYSLECKKDEEEELKLVQYKARDSRKQIISIHANFSEGTFEATERPRVRDDRDKLELLRSIVEAQPGITQNQVIEQSGLRRAEAIALLKAKEGKLWRSHAGPRNSRLYDSLGGGLTGSGPVPTGSRIDSETGDLDCFREPVPEDGRTGSGIDSQRWEPVEGSRPVPIISPLCNRGDGTVGALPEERDKVNGKTVWNPSE